MIDHLTDTIVAESASLITALTEQIKSKGTHHTIYDMIYDVTVRFNL